MRAIFGPGIESAVKDHLKVVSLGRRKLFERIEILGGIRAGHWG
jgi:hypothetical protein